MDAAGRAAEQVEAREAADLVVGEAHAVEPQEANHLVEIGGSVLRLRCGGVLRLSDVVSVGRAVIEAKAAEATEGDRR